jgi:triosephosphate isomerase (TIM)
MRIALIAGNWKMNKTQSEARELAQNLKERIGGQLERGCVVLCPPFTDLGVVKTALSGSNIKLGAQNMHWEKEGAFTGEISPSMLLDSGCSYVIIGHSERRKFFGESNQNVNDKIKAALSFGLTPVVCVGESLEERESGKAFDIVNGHIKAAVEGLSADELQRIVIAYEPVWAIGTGKTATPEQAEQVHKYIRDILEELYSEQTAESILILYGGSVKPDNIIDLITQPDIDGALVGGASLKVDSFAEIVKKAVENV